MTTNTFVKPMASDCSLVHTTSVSGRVGKHLAISSHNRVPSRFWDFDTNATPFST